MLQTMPGVSFSFCFTNYCFHFQMEKRRSSFPFVFRRSRPDSPDSFTGKRTLDIINKASNTSDHSSSSRTKNRKSKTSSSHNYSTNNNNNNTSKSLIIPGVKHEQHKGNSTKSGGLIKPQKTKKNADVSSVLFNVIPVISLTSADNETIDDLDQVEEPLDPNEVITILPA